ncbi:MAG: hypothetical protein ACXWT4_10145 [Methylobacter sp.]
MPGKPGVYKAVVFLRSHFQLDELSISMRLEHFQIELMTTSVGKRRLRFFC